MTGAGDARPLGRKAFEGLFAGLPGPVLLAVSGGPDSTALMHAAARWAAGRGAPPPHVATVDHGLRAASRGEAEAVAAAAASLGLSHHVLVWTRSGVRAASQATAREARYRLLCDRAVALGLLAIATAHTLDDQAETVMIRLAAGSGPAGLAGMPAVSRRRGSVRHHRPFLSLPKASLVATCRHEGWAFAEDPSNRDGRFARARWRGLMPALAAEGLDAARLARLAERVRRAEAALDAAADAAAVRSRAPAGPPGTVALDARRLAAEPEEIVLRVLVRAVRAAGSGDAGPEAAAPSLERAERCLLALLGAVAEGRPHRRTLAGRLLSLDAGGMLAIGPEPLRSRGRARPVTLPAAEAPHSLGRGDERA